MLAVCDVWQRLPRQGGTAAEALAPGRLLDRHLQPPRQPGLLGAVGDLHGGERPGEADPVLVVTALQSHRPLLVGALPTAGTVLPTQSPWSVGLGVFILSTLHCSGADLGKAGALHGGGHGGGDAAALALVQFHILLAGSHQLFRFTEFLLGQVDLRRERLAVALKFGLTERQIMQGRNKNFLLSK